MPKNTDAVQEFGFCILVDYEVRIPKPLRGVFRTPHVNGTWVVEGEGTELEGAIVLFNWLRKPVDPEHIVKQIIEEVQDIL